ncbi:MAG: hypothetical protein GF317_16060 [Candidatus Lokiarchaeota archaeon]|nr:hypothetical protein [Candidatus Lokiarchaeota archaeon]MBD3201049.1 hypothetical protein [Candidatus Lokiarchaeota archaeon]
MKKATLGSKFFYILGFCSILLLITLNLPNFYINTHLSSKHNNLTYEVSSSNLNQTYAFQHAPFEWIDVADLAFSENINLTNSIEFVRTLPWEFPFYDDLFNDSFKIGRGYITFNIDQDIFFGYDIVSKLNEKTIVPWLGSYVLDNSMIEFGYNDSKIVVTWKNFQSRYDPSDPNTSTFQVILYRNGSIQFNYKRLIWDYPYIGINKGDGEYGLSFSGWAFYEDWAVIGSSNGDLYYEKIFINKTLKFPLLANNSDIDLLSNDLEDFYGTMKDSRDSDWDRLDDYTEIMIGTDPLSPDTDNDGLSDQFEYLYFGKEAALGINQSFDFSLYGDPDEDLLPNYIEYMLWNDLDKPYSANPMQSHSITPIKNDYYWYMDDGMMFLGSGLTKTTEIRPKIMLKKWYECITQAEDSFYKNDALTAYSIIALSPEFELPSLAINNSYTNFSLKFKLYSTTGSQTVIEKRATEYDHLIQNYSIHLMDIISFSGLDYKNSLYGAGKPSYWESFENGPPIQDLELSHYETETFLTIPLTINCTIVIFTHNFSTFDAGEILTLDIEINGYKDDIKMWLNDAPYDLRIIHSKASILIQSNVPIIIQSHITPLNIIATILSFGIGILMNKYVFKKKLLGLKRSENWNLSNKNLSWSIKEVSAGKPTILQSLFYITGVSSILLIVFELILNDHPIGFIDFWIGNIYIMVGLMIFLLTTPIIYSYNQLIRNKLSMEIKLISFIALLSWILFVFMLWYSGTLQLYWQYFAGFLIITTIYFFIVMLSSNVAGMNWGVLLRNHFYHLKTGNDLMNTKERVENTQKGSLNQISNIFKRILSFILFFSVLIVPFSSMNTLISAWIDPEYFQGSGGFFGLIEQSIVQLFPENWALIVFVEFIALYLTFSLAFASLSNTFDLLEFNYSGLDNIMTKWAWTYFTPASNFNSTQKKNLLSFCLFQYFGFSIFQLIVSFFSNFDLLTIPGVPSSAFITMNVLLGLLSDIFFIIFWIIGFKHWKNIWKIEKYLNSFRLEDFSLEDNVKIENGYIVKRKTKLKYEPLLIIISGLLAILVFFLAFFTFMNIYEVSI